MKGDVQANATNRMYTAGKVFGFLRDMIDHLPDLITAQKSGRISKAFSERIMLAVTEVNGCRYCSYAHTRMALEAGMTDGEIKAMLAGIHDDVPEEESAAVCFAHHYAESAAQPDHAAVADLVDRYGKGAASDILAYIRMITVGNTLGSALDALLSRMRGNAFSNSFWWNEVVIVFGFPFVLVALLVRFGVNSLLGHKPKAL